MAPSLNTRLGKGGANLLEGLLLHFVVCLRVFFCDFTDILTVYMLPTDKLGINFHVCDYFATVILRLITHTTVQET